MYRILDFSFVNGLKFIFVKKKDGLEKELNEIIFMPIVFHIKWATPF